MAVPLCVWTSIFTLTCTFYGIESASLKFYHGSLLNYTTTPVEEPLTLLPFFNKSLVSMFYIFGFNETADSEDATVMLSAYLKTGYTNVVLVDWSNEARAPAGEVVFTYIFSAVPNSIVVGRALGKALLMLIGNGISEDKIHLVGHSLGAHVAGYAGESVQAGNHELARGRDLQPEESDAIALLEFLRLYQLIDVSLKSRMAGSSYIAIKWIISPGFLSITGLDPAGPLFEELISLVGLRPFRAKFVDVLHTNPKQYGMNKPIGSVDFWANCGDLIQPGCPNDKWINNLDSFCSHWRSYLIFSEAILSPTSILTVQADSCADWYRYKNSSQIIYLGDLIDTSARGNFFFSTRSEAPLSKGKAGLVPNN